MTLKLRLSLTALAICALTGIASAETMTINGKEYQADKLIQREIGPGTTYTRWRIPDFPLNVNVMTVDLDNPYNRIETMQANERLGSTERYEHASERLDGAMHKSLGGVNGNFWCVSGQAPWSDLLIGTTFGGSVRNGKIICETNAYSDQWVGGPTQSCVVGIDSYKRLWLESMHWRGTISSETAGAIEFIQVNKVVRSNELGLYNSFYPTDKTFQPVNEVDGHFVVTPGDATEVYLKLLDGQDWRVATNFTAKIEAINKNAGTGHLGDYDIALVGRGGYADFLNKLTVGETITINHGWTSYESGQTPIIENMLQGLALCLKDGVKIEESINNSYNSTVYARTAYGSSADKRTLYMMVFDKSTDPVYGASAGCTASVMCDIALAVGCANLAPLDGGGSSQMLVEGKVINKTTEATPRAIANGWMVFSTAPNDADITRLAFDDVTLRVPPFSSSMPRVIAYNKYGDIVDDYFMDFELSCDKTLGICEGSTFIAGKGGQKGTLTATYNGISVSKEIEIVDSDITLRLNPILIDATREYLIEVNAELDGKTYKYEPTDVAWTVDDPTIAMVDPHGMLHGLKNGTTTITGTIGDFTDQATINVEIAPDAKISVADTFNEWKGTGASGMKVNTWQNGCFEYTYNSPRSPKLTATNTPQTAFYSLPDRITMNFTSTIPVAKIEVDIRTRFNKTQNNITITPDEGDTWTANDTHEIEIPFPADALDLGTYPLTINKIAFTTDVNTSYKGAQKLTINDLVAHYNNFASVSLPIADADAGDDSPVMYYNMQGVRVNPSNLTPGVYIKTCGAKAQKIIIR